MIKKYITLFFLLLFLTQLLPIRQVGQLIAKATMTEELPETGSAKTTSDTADLKWFYLPGTSGNMALAGYNKDLYMHFSVTLPSHLASDVQTPPPNSFC